MVPYTVSDFCSHPSAYAYGTTQFAKETVWDTANKIGNLSPEELKKYDFLTFYRDNLTFKSIVGGDFGAQFGNPIHSWVKNIQLSTGKDPTASAIEGLGNKMDQTTAAVREQGAAATPSGGAAPRRISERRIADGNIVDNLREGGFEY